jgi:predicted dehydrogenase
MDSRRRFIGTVATGIAGTIASPPSVLGANERVRVGVIGPGDRGMQIAREAAACPNVEIVAFADVYTKRLEQARALAPQAGAYLDYRALLEHEGLDAVLIATPQHLHCEEFVAALEAGKHVYIERAMALTVNHARRMREAFGKSAGRLAVQVGHQACSSGMAADATAYVGAGVLGRVTAIHGYNYRNTPHGKPQWARPIYPDMNPENIDWDRFAGESGRRDFDANRYVNWRLFWDYSGGAVHENMSQQIAFWYKALGLGIPAAVTMTGGVYLWKDGREAPDTMSVAMEHSEGLLFSWDAGFGNNHLGAGEEVLGTHGTISKSGRIRFTPQKVNAPSGREMLGQTQAQPNAHMRNWLDCVRTGSEPACPFDLGFRVSIACAMAVESYREGRTVRWDAASERIV